MKNLFGDDKGMTGLTKALKQQKFPGNMRTTEVPSSTHTELGTKSSSQGEGLAARRLLYPEGHC